MTELTFIAFDKNKKQKGTMFINSEYNIGILSDNIDELSVLKSIFDKHSTFFNITLFDEFSILSRCNKSHYYAFHNNYGYASFNFTKNWPISKNRILQALFPEAKIEKGAYPKLKIPPKVSSLEVEFRFNVDLKTENDAFYSDPCFDVISNFIGKNDVFIEVNDDNMLKLICAPGFMYDIFQAYIRPQFLVRRQIFDFGDYMAESELLNVILNNRQFDGKIGYIDNLEPLEETIFYYFDINNYSAEHPISKNNNLLINEKKFAEHMFGEGCYEIDVKGQAVVYRKIS